MNRHLSLRSGNPALTKNTFKNLEVSNSNRMTLEGTVNKTIIGIPFMINSVMWPVSRSVV